jgi:hypothetical protein
MEKVAVESKEKKETEITQARKQYKMFIVEKMLSKAKPWEPIMDEYLSSKELLKLLGVDPEAKRYQYQELLRFCELAVLSDNDHTELPDNLRNCFTGGAVKILAFKVQHGNSKGARIEYRVALADIAANCRLKALDIVLKRIGTVFNLKEKTRLTLRMLALQNNKSLSQIINDMASKAIEDKVLDQREEQIL